MSQHPELLAPAGNWDCVRAAVANGADAVYFGLPRFNARMRADNFSESDLPQVVRFCHRSGVRAYVALNTLVFTGELDDAAAALRSLSRSGVDSIIVQDVGLIKLAGKIVPDLAVHASTQMTITSPEGVRFARDLGVRRVVLGREVSLRELERFEHESLNSTPLEVFVHGALCVAYSGQCLTSEALGQRSANRGECAQACRMPYDLIVDGVHKDLGDKKYLLSPQDLAAVDHIPALLKAGVTSFKIEGRLKAPEYVAAVCQVYRKALDAALEGEGTPASAADRYQLEMSFSRGLFHGWMEGVDHQQLVPARFGKKRGPFVGRLTAIGKDYVELDALVPLQRGDGIVFDTGGDTNHEQGGRIYEIRGRRLFFQRDHLQFAKFQVGDRVWKTDDPALNKRLQQSYAGAIAPRRRAALQMRATGSPGGFLTVQALDSNGVILASEDSQIPLQEARNAPLTHARLLEHLDRFGDAPFEVASLTVEFSEPVILPISELNRVRRALGVRLEEATLPVRVELADSWRTLLDPAAMQRESLEMPKLTALCRTDEQLDAALEAGVEQVYLDFEDVRRYKDSVARVRSCSVSASIWLATPRIQKAAEQGFFRLIQNAQPDGVLVRNLGAIEFFREASSGSGVRLAGDFSLNVSNPLTAQEFLRRGLETLTVSYDLTLEQVLDLARGLPRAALGGLELTLHQHIPMFHMEHCVFAAFLSKGSSFLDCGRPCDTQKVHLRDRVGKEHPLRADAGCRNTLFNAVAQTGAQFYDALFGAGLRRFRVELLEEDGAATGRLIGAYQALLRGERSGGSLWREFHAQSQLGVTRGTLSAREA
jgi:putative protease